MFKKLLLGVAVAVLALAAVAAPPILEAPKSFYHQPATTADEPSGAMPQLTVLRWQGEKKFMAESIVIAAEKRSSPKEGDERHRKGSAPTEKQATAPEHPLLL